MEREKKREVKELLDNACDSLNKTIKVIEVIPIGELTDNQRTSIKYINEVIKGIYTQRQHFL